ncbi:unnamed protein product [Leptidea sinapis]|uniref:CCHC-type domain-containing protein n=1 Tax=Leptidea sinapis TaxID=189913 RepID=A0A5E4Q039_9NEOP|nr:unnamed protein product [Leptidea sinapis]
MPIRKLEPFNVGNNNWDAYILRSNQFITLNEIKSELEVATLVTVVGAECYELLCDLTAPDAPESKTYKGKCRFKRYTCDNCGEKGHLKAVCDKNKSECIKRVKPKKDNELPIPDQDGACQTSLSCQYKAPMEFSVCRVHRASEEKVLPYKYTKLIAFLYQIPTDGKAGPQSQLNEACIFRN